MFMVSSITSSSSTTNESSEKATKEKDKIISTSSSTGNAKMQGKSKLYASDADGRPATTKTKKPINGQCFNTFLSNI